MNSEPNRKGILQYLGLSHHEYWPWWSFVAPVWPLWAWYMLRTGRTTWFTAVNPGMEDSGFMGESKIRILRSIPSQYIPDTIFIKHLEPFEQQWEERSFPRIAKPDIGGRGRKVQIVHSLQELHEYHAAVGEDYMVQEIIYHPLELGVFYIRIPDEASGYVVSIAEKGFLKVRGDGQSSIRELMRKDERAAMQVERLEKELDLNQVLPDGEMKLLEPIGNHVRGTKFINREDMICDRLHYQVDKIAKQIPGFYYGRFDLRVSGWDAMLEGKDIFILELNGLTSDPAHIFDPYYRFRDVLKTQFSNCRKAFRIARYNLSKGVKPTPFWELFRKAKEHW